MPRLSKTSTKIRQAAIYIAFFIVSILSVADFSHALTLPDIEIIPLPKKMSSLAGFIPVKNDLVIARTKNTERKIDIGIEEISRKLTELKNSRVTVRNINGLKDLDANIIYIGLLKDTFISSLFHQRNIKHEPLGDEGYMIKFLKHRGKDIIVLTGETPQGTMYACITFCGLLRNVNGMLHIRKIDVWDRPDYRYRMSGSIMSDRARAFQTIDFALQHKLNMVWAGYRIDIENIDRDRIWLKKINDYAWDRGIRIVYWGYWDVGKAPVPPRAGYYYYPYGEYIGHRGLAFSWCEDGPLRKKAEYIKRFIQTTNARAIYLHSIDSGGDRDPELWSKRSRKCRERFGNDRAAADAYVINTFYRAAREASSDAMFIAVPHPYRAKFLASNQTTRKWLERLAALIPADVFLCNREGLRSDLALWGRTAKQPVFLYHEAEPRDWELKRPFISSFRFARTFYFGTRKDVYWYVSEGIMSKVRVLGASEYSWNTGAPGSQEFQNLENPPLWAQAVVHPNEFKEYFLPRACKALFGKADVDLCEVISYNLSPHLMVKPGTWLTESHCRQQNENALKALATLRSLRGKIGPSHEVNFQAYMSYALSTRYLTDVRLNIFKIRYLIRNSNRPAAALAAAQALETLEAGEKDFISSSGNYYSLWTAAIDYGKARKVLTEEIAMLTK